jgi:tRNA(Ile)-lysidine synthase
LGDAVRAGTTDDPVTASEAAMLFAGLGDEPALILAVSGGPDSTALMWLAARWRARRKRGPKMIAATVDHGLRKESAGEAREVARLARKLGVAHRILRWTGKKPATGIQEAARNARYRLLNKAAREANARHILTAHTLDDQAETVLFRMTRGSGVTGLRGMAPQSSVPLPLGTEHYWRNMRRHRKARRPLILLRPFLHVPKSRLMATLAAARIQFADDASNRDPRFARPRLRELMRALATEGLDANRLDLLARRLTRADHALEDAVLKARVSLSGPWRGTKIEFASGYRELPPEIGLRLLGRAISWVGDEGSVELGKLENLFEAMLLSRPEDGAGFRRTLAGAMVTLSDGRLTVERQPPRRIVRKRRKTQRKARFTTAG